MSEALASYLSTSYDFGDFDRDSLATVARHYHETAQSNRHPNLALFHYADMIADQRGTVKRRGKISDTDLALYNARMAELVPDTAQRNWLEFGDSAASPI